MTWYHMIMHSLVWYRVRDVFCRRPFQVSDTAPSVKRFADLLARLIVWTVLFGMSSCVMYIETVWIILNKPLVYANKTSLWACFPTAVSFMVSDAKTTHTLDEDEFTTRIGATTGLWAKQASHEAFPTINAKARHAGDGMTVMLCISTAIDIPIIQAVTQIIQHLRTIFCQITTVWITCFNLFLQS